MGLTSNGSATGGFGLKFVKKICTKYELKYGKFANIKKKIGPWYMDALHKQPQSQQMQLHNQQMQEQSAQSAQSEQKQSAQSMKPPMSEPVMQSQQSEGNTATPITNKAKWFWMDMDNFEWVAYRDVDQ